MPRRRAPPTTKAKQREFIDEALRLLRAVRKQMHNRVVARRRRTPAPPTTAKMRRQIKRLYHIGGYSMQVVAQKLNTSIGRVSETISGKRR